MNSGPDGAARAKSPDELWAGDGRVQQPLLSDDARGKKRDAAGGGPWLERSQIGWCRVGSWDKIAIAGFAWEAIVGYSTRVYLFAEGDVKRIARRVVEGLLQGTDALPAYARTRQKIASIAIEAAGRKVVGIVGATGEYWKFDKVGKLDKEEFVSAISHLLAIPERAESAGVIDLAPKIKRKEWEKENRWELSKADLDLIAADLEIDGFPRHGPRLQSVGGTAEKPFPLTYEGGHAIDQVDTLFVQILSLLEGLSEQALKGVVSEARRRGEPDTAPLWIGLGDVADRKREILARRRNGKGSWYAVIEGVRKERASDAAEIFTLEFEKCGSLKSAEEAARRLLAKNAEHFSDVVGIEAVIYSDLEWSPDEWDLRRSQSPPGESDTPF